MSTYTTKQGDMWDAIAYNQMGSVAYTDQLILKNLAYRNYYTFPAGIVLTLPEVTTETASSLPPWKQVST